LSRIRPRDLIVIGRIIRPHGLTGLLRIVSYAQSQETFLRAGSVFLNTDQDDVIEWKIVSIHPHQSCYLLKLLGLDSVNQAEAFKGADILITFFGLNS